MKLLTLAVAALTLSLPARADKLPPIKFFGYTFSFNTCAIWVLDGGYTVVRYGGYVQGIYRSDACFGSEPKLASASSTLMENIRFAQVQSKVLLIKLEADQLYSTLLNRAEKLESACNVLHAAAEDGLPKAQLKQFYSDVKFEYEMLTYDYYPVHVKAQNPQVAEAWKQIVKGMEKLKTDFESSDD